MNKFDWLGLLGILIMVIGGSLITYYITTESINKCTSDPLKYTSNTLAGEGNYSYVQLYIYKSRGDVIPIIKREIDLTDYSANKF